jgi:hypothetical protein
MMVASKIFLSVSDMFLKSYFVGIVNSLDPIKMVQNYKPSCKLTDTEEMLYGC